MTDAARDAYRHNAITAEHADILAQVPVHQQASALEACFSEMLFYSVFDETEETGAATSDTQPNDVREAIEQGRWDLLAQCLESASSLRRWITTHSTADVADEAVQADIPELAVAIADAAAEDAALLQVSLDESLQEGQAKTLGVVRRARWIEIDESGTFEPNRVSTERCEFMRQAVITHPVTPRAVRVVTVCIKRSCGIHRPAPAVATDKSFVKATERERKAVEQRQKQEADLAERMRVWKEEQRPKYLSALSAAVLKMKTVTPQLVRTLVTKWDIEQIETAYALTLGPKTALAILLLSFAGYNDWETGNPDSNHMATFGGAFGLAPSKWLKAQKPAKVNKVATPKPTAKAKKKGVR